MTPIVILLYHLVRRLGLGPTFSFCWAKAQPTLAAIIYTVLQQCHKIIHDVADVSIAR